MTARWIASELVDLVLPRSCLGCGRPGVAVCRGCVAPQLSATVVAGLSIVAAGTYGGTIRAALLSYKERGRRDLAGPLAELLGHAVDACGGHVLVPIPSTPGAARRRGGDHVHRLARLASRSSQRPVVDSLRLARRVLDSSGLDSRQRSANLYGAMRAAPPPSAASALIVDDIVTTATTVREAARALRAAGWRVSGAAVVAATARRRASLPG